MILSRFKVVETLSRRGSDQTFKCQDAEFGDIVLKVFESVSEQQKSRLQQLSESLSRLSHEGLQEHLGYFENEEHVALAFKWTEGLTLAQEIEQGVRYTDEELFQQMERILEALSLAHGSQPPLIHRDIKPENMVRTPDGWVLIDFGASRQAAFGDGEASVIGTTGYAAPEQFFGQALPASDQYGLAATVLHLATHRHPTDFPLKKLNLEIEDAGLSRRLMNVLNRMLSPDPKNRFQDAESASKAIQSGSGMQEWQLALAPLAEADTVLKTTMHDDALEIEIGARVHKKSILFSVFMLILFLSVALIRVYQGMILSQWIGTLASTAIFIGIFVRPSLRRGWLALRPARVFLKPEGWRLEHAGKVVSEGTRPPEVLVVFGMVDGFSVKLRDVDQVTPSFGYSLNPVEMHTLQGVVAAYGRPHLPERTPRVVDESQALVVRPADVLQGVARRPSVLRSLSSLNQSFRVLPPTPKLEAHFRRISESDRALFDHSGFKRAGFVKESLWGVFGQANEVLFNGDGTIALHIRKGDFGISESRDTPYYMATLMSDGRYRLTYSMHHSLRPPTEGLVYSASSKGDFEKDLEAHRAWIAEELEVHDSLPVQMATMEDRVAILRHHVRHTEAKSTSLKILTVSFLFLSTVFSAVAFFVSLFV